MSNHNARNVNHPKPRSKPDSTATGRIMPKELKGAVRVTISKVPSDLVAMLDKLAAKQDRTRSSFVRRQFQRIAAGERTKAT